MHALWPRASQFTTHTLTLLSVLVLASSLVSYRQVQSRAPISSLALANEPGLKRDRRERCDTAMLKLNLDLDLNPLWTWNTAHVFLYIVARYESGSHPRNEVVVWDHIVSSRAEAVVTRPSAWNKYPLRDHGYGLKGVDVSLALRYAVMPHMGALTHGEGAAMNFTLPDAYYGANTQY